jgi:hypothetical protein
MSNSILYQDESLNDIEKQSFIERKPDDDHLHPEKTH